MRVTVLQEIQKKTREIEAIAIEITWTKYGRKSLRKKWTESCDFVTTLNGLT